MGEDLSFLWETQIVPERITLLKVPVHIGQDSAVTVKKFEFGTWRFRDSCNILVPLLVQE